MELRALRYSTDRDALERLWVRALAPAWRLLPGVIDLLRNGFVAVGSQGIVGAVSVEPPGSVQFIAVDPEAQRRGIGSQLLGAALASLCAGGAQRATAGSGAPRCIWPGVPGNLPGAVEFFTRHGWTWDYTASDLVQDLAAADPSSWHRRLRWGGAIDAAGASDMEDVRAFEQRHFPNWARWFVDPDTVLVARDSDGNLRGTLILDGPGRVTIFWPMLGERTGTIACVGVDPSTQNQGIGTALLVAASRRLAERGVEVCHVSWVVRLEFYQYVGYRVWRDYRMGSRPLT